MDKAIEEVAQHLYAIFERNKGFLQQAHAVAELHKRFAGQFVVPTKGGGEGVSPKVKAEFRKLADMVWSDSEKGWRRREPGDGPGQRHD